jgi:hypothetical protein
LIFAAL